MLRIMTTTLAAAVCIASAVAVQADGNNAGISDQNYKGGKYGGGHAGHSIAVRNCPVEFRGIYRGNLYCRKPAYAVHAPRHPQCPTGFNGLYRGSLYCFGRG